MKCDNCFRYAEIVLPLNLPHTLTYGIPIDMQEHIAVGMRVEVSLNTHSFYSGIVISLHNNKPNYNNIKPIRSLLDNEPILATEQVRFWQWVQSYYMASLGDVMNTALPAHLKLMNETRIEWAYTEETFNIEWSKDAEPLVNILKQQRIMTIQEIREKVGAKSLPIIINELLINESIYVIEGLEPSYKPKFEKIICLADFYTTEDELSKLFDNLKRSPRQLDILMTFLQMDAKQGYVVKSELIKKCNDGNTAFKPLLDKGVLIESTLRVDRIKNKSICKEELNYQLSLAQQECLTNINMIHTQKDVCLIQGVTGSGKTFIYIELIKSVIKQGGQVLFLIPEIALTTQLVMRFTQYFNEELAVYHSRFSNNERVEIWEQVRKGKFKVILGTRSSLWLPFRNLKLIIIDEEHDLSFKQQDPAPRFHARDAAIFASTLYQAKVLLGSATPSVESLYNVQIGKYGFTKLSERYAGIQMPEILIVNAQQKSNVPIKGIKSLSVELYEAIFKALYNKKQVILFQNKRGYSPFQICQYCGWVPQCANCSVAFTYHKTTDKLHCHYCGTKTSMLHHCLNCGSTSILNKNYGTQRVEEEVIQLFPKAHVARMDLDTTRGKSSIEQIINKLSNGQIDILVGTQMVVKGLDFPNIALVGILNADSILSFPDFRTNERAFQMMTQVSGRAGRMGEVGTVIIQSFNTQHPVLNWVKNNDLHGFYVNEIAKRKEFEYPPFRRIIKIICKHKDEHKAIEVANLMLNIIPKSNDILAIGPIAASIAKVRNLYIQEVWIKCKLNYTLIEQLKEQLLYHRLQIIGKKGFSSSYIIFDVDPQ